MQTHFVLFHFNEKIIEYYNSAGAEAHEVEKMVRFFSQR